MPSSIAIGRILGIRVDIHFSLFLIVAFLSWSLATGFLPDRYPNWSTATYWSTGFVCALSLFVSVLLHEFAHSLVAIRRGYKVEGITLFLLGGVSNIASESRRALDDFVISVVGTTYEPRYRSGHRRRGPSQRRIVARLRGRSSTSRSSICCWDCSTCCPRFRWTAGGCLGRPYGLLRGAFAGRRGFRLEADRWWAFCWWDSVYSKSYRAMRCRGSGRCSWDGS